MSLVSKGLVGARDNQLPCGVVVERARDQQIRRQHAYSSEGGRMTSLSKVEWQRKNGVPRFPYSVCANRASENRVFIKLRTRMV